MLWSSEEVVTALYFASRKITLEAVSALLSRRGYNRSSVAVNKKLGELRQVEKELYNGSRQGWNLAAVDKYLDSLLHCTTVNMLIKTTEEDHHIIIEVCCLALRILLITNDR